MRNERLKNPACPECGKPLKRKTYNNLLYYECENPKCLIIRVRIPEGYNHKGDTQIIKATVL